MACTGKPHGRPSKWLVQRVGKRQQQPGLTAPLQGKSAQPPKELSGPLGVRRDAHSQLKRVSVPKQRSSPIYYGALEPSESQPGFISGPLHLWIWCGHLVLPHQGVRKAQRDCEVNFLAESRPREQSRAQNQAWLREVEGGVIGGSHDLSVLQ